MTDQELIDLKDMQLAECTRVMREVAAMLGAIRAGVEANHDKRDILRCLEQSAAKLMQARAGK